MTKEEKILIYTALYKLFEMIGEEDQNKDQECYEYLEELKKECIKLDNKNN